MIEVKRLSKSFKLAKKAKPDQDRSDPRFDGRWFHAVKDVSFKVEGGTILGLLGPNGAGKTTLLRLLSTSLSPTSGSASVMGTDLSQDPIGIRKRIGFLSGNTGLYARLTPREMLAYYGRLHGMSRDQIDRKIQDLSQKLEMGSFLDKRCATLSSGMKQKVSISRTLLHDPSVVVLDEPTTGLDVSAAEHILDLVASLRDQGSTVLFSTHHMHEVDRLCDQIVLIDQGGIKFTGDLDAMKQVNPKLDKAFLQIIGKGGQ